MNLLFINCNCLSVNILAVVVYFQKHKKKKKKPSEPRATCYQSSQINVLYQFPPLQKCLWGWYDLAEGGTDHSPKQRDRLCVGDNDTKTNQREEKSSSLTFLPKSQKSTYLLRRAAADQEPQAVCMVRREGERIFSTCFTDKVWQQGYAEHFCDVKPQTVRKSNAAKLVFLVLFHFRGGSAW